MFSYRCSNISIKKPRSLSPVERQPAELICGGSIQKEALFLGIDPSLGYLFLIHNALDFFEKFFLTLGLYYLCLYKK
jgi:hypothetical protein